jgi:hypothetical protein
MNSQYYNDLLASKKKAIMSDTFGLVFTLFSLHSTITHCKSLGHCRRSRRGALRGWLGVERDWAKGLGWEGRELTSETATSFFDKFFKCLWNVT